MEDVVNNVQSCEMYSQEDQALMEKNKKRSVKTHAQVQALEKFYNEHKYPTESMKTQFAESIGLTEKQVSGWFCHRRSKDKRLMNGDIYVTKRQERSSGVIQDHGNGHRQDSCGSTKQGYDRNFDTREVESGRLTLQECSAARITHERGDHYSGYHNHTDDVSSASDSSLHNMSHHHKGYPLDVAASRSLMQKLPMDLTRERTRPGPSGYLKLKVQLERTATIAVKKQLGKHYREDGPPLGVEFDTLPPGAFESSIQDPVNETCYAGEGVPATLDYSKIYQHPNFGKGCEYNSSIMASHNSDMDRTRFRKLRGSDSSDNYLQQKFKQNTSLYNTAAYYPGRNSFSESAEVFAGDKFGSESRDDNGVRSRCGVEGKRISLQPFGANLSREQESSFHKYNVVAKNSSRRENIEILPSNLTIKSSKIHNSLDQAQPRQTTKDGKTHAERRGRLANENSLGFPATAQRRLRDEFPQSCV